MRWITMIALTLLLLLRANAQLAPGPLSEAHASLEGVQNCTLCHELGKAVSNRLCLECHQELSTRIQQNRGFHALSVPRDTSCASCHSEHNGRAFQLIYWGKQGQESFDHALTGHVLTGKHAEQDCRSCHKPEWLSRELKADTSLSIENSFLGLSINCTTCHADEHQGQMDQDCSLCHTQEAWRPTSFSHDSTDFPLTGKHAGASCDACHERRDDLQPAGVLQDAAASKGWHLVYKRQQSTSCVACHDDVHKGRLGQDCSKCHTTSGWQGAATDFDHDISGFVLLGKHQELECGACHKREMHTDWKGNGCTDCHADAHCGQFNDAVGHTDCSLCHDQQSFAQHHFSLQRHQQCDMPLVGAHAAVPCTACHKRKADEDCLNYRPVHDDCDKCHVDPHGGQAQNWFVTGCTTCHETGNWSPKGFDHSDTRFPLTNKHLEVACGACHVGEDWQGQQFVPLRRVPRNCSACHDDVHGGQFASQGFTDCSRCHNTTGWENNTFDHNRQTRFMLDGGHADLECSVCHKVEVFADGQQRVRYRATPRDCRACHGNIVPQEEEDE